MGKALIIAEKPSVAGDIAKALGKFQKQQDYFENDEYVISSAVGHLLTIVPPPGVEAAKGKWAFKNLPVIPTVYGASFDEYSTAHFTGWPSASAQYESGSPNTPTNEVIVLHLKPVS